MDAELYEIATNYLASVPLEAQFGIQLTHQGELLKTPAGNLVLSHNYPLIRHMIGELEEYPTLQICDGHIVKPRALSTYLLHSTKIDFVENEGAIDRKSVERLLDSDPILEPSAGPEWTDQLRSWAPIDGFLKSLNAELLPKSKYEKETWERLITAITDRWSRLSPAAKSVAINLRVLAEGNLIAAIALASRACSDVEFGNVVLATKPMHQVFGFPYTELEPRDQHISAFRFYRDLARVCSDYLSFFPAEAIALIVQAGETSTVEFKSTFRWDVRQGKKSEDVTFASLKTIAAFLNSEGGQLIIGVADDATPVGIELDEFENDDKFMLHFYSVLKEHMGTAVTTLVKAEMEMFDGKKVCVVNCKRSGSPVYVRGKGKEEKFFVRTGPSSEQLGPSDLVKYISEHFPNRQPAIWG